MIRDVNRPALQLSGYFEHFEQSRVQIIGTVEYTYLQQLDEKKKEAIYREFMAYDIPCVIFCRDLKPDEMFLKIAEESNLPVFGTKRSTSEFMAELIYCLSEQLAPCITIHGVLVDVYGEGRSFFAEQTGKRGRRKRRCGNSLQGMDLRTKLRISIRLNYPAAWRAVCFY